MDWHSLSVNEAALRLKTDIKNGLSETEAEKRLRENGKNILSGKKKKSFLKKFISQFSDFMVLVLLLACAVSFLTSFLSGDKDYIDCIIILFIVILNAFIGTVQESRAEKALEALKKLSAPRAKVIRSGSFRDIEASALVKGDVISLSAGDSVPADCLIIESSSLKAEESSLTGESEPAEKKGGITLPVSTHPGDRKNCLFSATAITLGSCRALVTETGMDTAVGAIAGLIDEEESPQTPLQKRLGKTGKALGIGALIICAVIFFMGLMRKTPFLESFMLSVSLAVAAIPEGLPAVVTIVLSMGVQIMAKNNAIIRRLPAVETLGSTGVICSDKTGTLTKNKMDVREIYSAVGKEKVSSPFGKKLLTLGSVCCNCVYSGEKIMGEPTETAIAEEAEKLGIKKSETDKSYVRLRERPFSSERKMMSILAKRNGEIILSAKGAPDVIIKKCSKIYKDGKEVPLTAEDIKHLEGYNAALGEKALRVIAVACKKGCSLVSGEENLTFLGLIAMSDPIRPEAKQAVSRCRKAGIKTVMITGDHIITAKAIAKELGILKKGDIAMTGKELDDLSEEELKRKIKNCRVFARVTPAHKVRIVKAFRSLGEVVAMTGDGVNDAPALKAADIGCAMGENGTDVAKAAADMVLTDDNFATIVKAVRQGRIIYENIKKTVHFLLSSNIGEIVAIFFAYLMGLPTPLLPIQLLFINLITDSLPAMALGTEKGDGDIMLRKPQNAEKSMFSGGLWLDIAMEGTLIGILTIISFSLGLKFFDGGAEPLIGRTMAFTTLNLCELIHAFNMRNSLPMYKIGFFSNMKMTVTFVLCFILQVLVISLSPLGKIFSAVPLSPYQFAISLFLAAVPFFASETGKIFSFLKKRQRFTP